MDDDKKQKLKEKIEEYIERGEGKGMTEAATIAGPLALAMLLMAEDGASPNQLSMLNKAFARAKKIDPGLSIRNIVPFPMEDNALGSFMGKKIRHGLSSYWPSSTMKLFDGKGGGVLYGGDPHILLHELGHASTLGNKGIFRTIAPKLALPVGLGLAGLAAKSDDYIDYAPGIAAASTLPILYDEILASKMALQDMYKSLGRSEVMKGLLKLAPAFGSYVALPYGLYKGMQWAVDKIKAKKKMDKTASLFTLGFLDTLRRKRHE